MTVCYEVSLKDFEFWSGARALANLLEHEEIQEIEQWLEEVYSETNKILTETELNDFFWFHDDIIADILGFADLDAMWDYLIHRKKYG